MDAMEKTRTRVMFKHIFWASLAAEMKVIAVDPKHKLASQIKTMATDMKAIYYSTEWFEAQNAGVQLFGYMHEVAHRFALHGLRLKGRSDRELWNIACDHEINLALQRAGFEVWSRAYCDPRFASNTAEEIYEILKQEGQGKPQPCEGGMGGDILPEPGDSAEAEEIRAQVQAAVARASTLAQQAGQMDGNLERFVNSILRPSTPWWDQLRLVAKRLIRTNENWAVRNKRLRGVYLPGMRSYKLGEITIIGDTSGSITDQDLKLIAGVVRDAMEELQPSTIRMVWWDHCFQGEQEFLAGEEPVIKPVGGGGTRMDHALDYVSQNHASEAVILITDCETPWPDQETEYPLWVLSTSKRRAPIGETIHVSV
jgi:predicted metal-dependent peptidase